MRKLFTFLCAALMSVGMWADPIVAVPNPSSFYEPTQIENGGFETKPTMEGPKENRIPNGTNQGWNTTENGSNCFEWIGSKPMSSHNSSLYPIGDHCVEMNADNAATLYQDLYTNGGDVIRWSLAHAARTKGCGESEQDMKVEVGAPLYDGDNIVYPTGVNNNINTNINPDTKATYHSNGIDNPTGHDYGFNGQNLQNLKVKKSEATQWYYASGVYAVPDFQPVTRFAFVSEDPESPGCGNLLDDISFSTLIGDLSATYGDNNSVVIKGYWGETDPSKKLIINMNNTPYEVDMTSVSGQNFVITMTYDNKPTEVTIYHQDYVSAARTISVNYPISASAEDVELDCDGNAHTISPAVTVPTSGYTLKYGASYGGISRDELTYTMGTHPIYYSVSAPGYTTYKGKATLRINPVSHTVSFTVNNPAMGSLGVFSVVYSEDFDNGTFVLPDGWTNDAANPWVVANQTLKSGNAGKGSTTSTIQATYNFKTPGRISFSYRISSEATWDKGYFSIDGVNKIDGTSGVTEDTFTANVAAGEHTFKWWYKKDGSGNVGDDAFFIDNIVIYEFRTDITDTTCTTGDKFELLAIPKEDCNFARWEDNSTDENRVVTIDRDMTITANFTGFDITANLDPQNAGVYYSTFYHGSVDYALPAKVKAYKAAISGSDLLLSEVAAEGDVLPKGNAAILRSSVQNYTLTPSDATPVSVGDDNDLEGVDVETAVTSIAGLTTTNCYVLSGTNENGVGFYRINSDNLKAHKAYVKYVSTPGQGNAPRRMRFVFEQETVATGMESIQPSAVSSQKLIENGQLIIIKNGVRYNAQGQKVK